MQRRPIVGSPRRALRALLTLWGSPGSPPSFSLLVHVVATPKALFPSRALFWALAHLSEAPGHLHSGALQVAQIFLTHCATPHPHPLLLLVSWNCATRAPSHLCPRTPITYPVSQQIALIPSPKCLSLIFPSTYFHSCCLALLNATNIAA